MLADVLPYLWCPLCRLELVELDAAVRCPRGHSFDRAKQGYVHLTATPVAHTGDSAQMVDARAGFLAAGHYDFIARALADAVPGTDGLVVDVGAGTGYHLSAGPRAPTPAGRAAGGRAHPAPRPGAPARPPGGGVVGGDV